MGTGIKELKLWQEAVALGAEAVRLARASTKRETRAVCDRLMLAAADVATHVAAGYTHEAPEAQLAHYRQARASLVEVETLLAIGRVATLIPQDAALAASSRAGSVHRLLAGYVAYVDRQVGDAAARSATPGPAPP